MRVLVGSDVQVVSPPFVGADGETPIDCDSVPTVTVRDFAGESLTEVGAADVAGENGLYAVTLSRSSHTTVLNQLTLTWTGTADGLTQQLTQSVEVVGGFYASMPSIRQMPGIADDSTYPPQRVREVREEFEAIVDEYRGTSFVPRLRVQTVRHDCWWSLSSFLLDDLHPRVLRSIDVGGDAVADLSVWTFSPYGLLYSETSGVSGWAVGEAVTIAYEYGLSEPPPALQRACREYVRAVLLRETSGVDRDVISQSFEGMVTRYSTPDASAGRPTGYVEIDRLLNSLPDHRVPIVA